MDRNQYYKNLEVPKGPVDVVIDTDTYNEVDDQFAVAYLLANGDRLRTKALFAAPFSNHRVSSPAEGMEKSYEELVRLCRLAGREDLVGETYCGSKTYLPDEQTPVDSPAARQLVKLAEEHSPEQPLYVVCISAITDVASALLLKPEIRENIVVVWLGGNGRDYRDTEEFNMYQDIAAARVVFASGAPVVQLPCMAVVSAFRVTVLEINHYLTGKNPMAEFLRKRYHETVAEFPHPFTASSTIWDVTAVAWLLNEDDRFMESRLASVPVPQYDHRYSFDENRQIRYVYCIKRDELAAELIGKILSSY